tara:strand:+ start:3049 stop:4128 length:1080 start_codon:yes stop_codon:yes gene_type:complete
MIYRDDLKNIKPYQPGKPIEEVKRELRLKKVYKLASNESPFSPKYLKKALLAELENINRYPESSCFYLRKVLAKELKVKPETLVFGNGSDEIIALSLRALISEGDEVIVSYPSFLIYEIQAKIHGAKIKKVPLRNLKYSLDDIAKKINKRTKIIFIANPDNPTGSYLNSSQVRNFLKKIPKSIVVFLDEAYFEFAPKDFPKSLKLLKERGNIIITRTFSKAYSLAGLRIGYAITTKEIATILNTIREPFNINRIAQSCALTALKNKKFMRAVVAFTNNEKNYFYNQLSGLGLSFKESATNFVLVDFKKNTANLFKFLLKKGVIIRTLAGWGLPNYFRVTVGLAKENKSFIEYLKQYLKK